MPGSPHSPADSPDKMKKEGKNKLNVTNVARNIVYIFHNENITHVVNTHLKCTLHMNDVFILKHNNNYVIRTGALNLLSTNPSNRKIIFPFLPNESVASQIC